MYKYVYCHDSGEYKDYTNLKKSESKVFATLRECTSAGTFVCAPTTMGKAVLFSYTQNNGQIRVDGYKADYAELGSNPAAHIGNVVVEKPYYEDPIGALPGAVSFSNGEINATNIANLAQYVIFGDASKDVILLGGNIAKQATNYLKYLFLLVPPAYAQKVGFCINKYIKRELESGNKFLPNDEKPIIRIYALDSQKEFAGSYKVNLDASEPDAESSEIGAKALRFLIKQGATQANFDAICRVTESAFAEDGTLNKNEYTRLLVSAAYESSRSLEYAEALISYGFGNDNERRIFTDCINNCLKSGSVAQKKVAAAKAIELLRDDMDAVAENLFAHIVSQESVTPAEHSFLVTSAVKQLGGNSGGFDDRGLLGIYLSAVAPSWKQKYEFITEIIQRLFESGNKTAAHKVCKILSERFNKENLAYATGITIADLFVLKQNISPDAKIAIYASLLYNDCNASAIHSVARLYLKNNPSFGDILLVRHKAQEIFGFEANDFIFADSECVKTIRARLNKLTLDKLLEAYNGIESQITDYPELKAEFFAAILNLEKLKALDGSFIEAYKSFLSDAEIEMPDDSIAKAGDRDLATQLQQCKNYLAEKESDHKAQKGVQNFNLAFLQKLYDMLPENEQNEVKNRKKNSGDAQNTVQPADSKKVLGKYGANSSRGLHFNGTQAYRFCIALGLLSGFIACILMLIPAVCMAAAVGSLTFATVSMYLSRYFYLAVIAPVCTVVIYAILYVSVCKRNARTAFGLTALCAYIPCIVSGLGFVLSYIILT